MQREDVCGNMCKSLERAQDEKSTDKRLWKKLKKCVDKLKTVWYNSEAVWESESSGEQRQGPWKLNNDEIKGTRFNFKLSKLYSAILEIATVINERQVQKWANKF